MKIIKANDSAWIRGSRWLPLWELSDPFPAALWTGSDDHLDNGHILNTTLLCLPPPLPQPAVIGDSLLTTGRSRLQFLWCKALLPSLSLRNVKQSTSVAKKLTCHQETAPANTIDCLRVLTYTVLSSWRWEGSIFRSCRTALQTDSTSRADWHVVCQILLKCTVSDSAEDIYRGAGFG